MKVASTQTDFDDILAHAAQSGKTVVVDFAAQW